MSQSMEDIEIRQASINYAHEHFTHVYENEESRYLELDEILEDSKLIYQFLTSGLWEVCLYSIDRAFGYSYHKMEKGFASPKIKDVIKMAEIIKAEFDTV